MATKAKVPKRIAGVKMPKGLRKGLRKLAGADTGRAAISEFLETLEGFVATRQAAIASSSQKHATADGSMSASPKAGNGA